MSRTLQASYTITATACPVDEDEHGTPINPTITVDLRRYPEGMAVGLEAAESIGHDMETSVIAVMWPQEASDLARLLLSAVAAAGFDPFTGAPENSA